MNLMQLPDEQNSKRQVSDENYKLEKEKGEWGVLVVGCYSLLSSQPTQTHITHHPLDAFSRDLDAEGGISDEWKGFLEDG